LSGFISPGPTGVIPKSLKLDDDDDDDNNNNNNNTE
jgi:hypothetical protein